MCSSNVLLLIYSYLSSPKKDAVTRVGWTSNQLLHGSEMTYLNQWVGFIRYFVMYIYIMVLFCCMV